MVKRRPAWLWLLIPLAGFLYVFSHLDPGEVNSAQTAIDQVEVAFGPTPKREEFLEWVADRGWEVVHDPHSDATVVVQTDVRAYRRGTMGTCVWALRYQDTGGVLTLGRPSRICGYLGQETP